MVKLEETSGSELSRLIETGLRTVVIPFGSVEYHGGHLPLGSDALLADAVGELVAERLDAVLAPTVRVGYADRHMPGTGTLSVPTRTLCDLASSIARSLVAHGFRVIALISTHGGNRAALEEAAQYLNEQYADVVACAPRGDVGPSPGEHSGKWLTSVMRALRPELVDVGAARPELRDELRAASPEAGTENLARFVGAIVRQVEQQARDQRG